MADSEDDLLAEDAAERVKNGTAEDIWIPVDFLREDIPPPKAPLPSIAVQISRMNVVEKVKLAMLGGKEARILLTHDSNKVVRRYVLYNPRITEQEIAMIAQNRLTDEEQLRTIADKKEWMRNYQVRVALVKNPKTPLPAAIGLLPTLMEHDLARMAKSRDLPDGVLNHARRLVLERRERKQ
ncbi:MAG TPA: hypothetical protein VMS22_06790 [Candidatus Eisenbacteria bacterium]|nr:hypothetical protein [Candidatus Eisenbacteria bacterium]